MGIKTYHPSPPAALSLHLSQPVPSHTAILNYKCRSTQSIMKKTYSHELRVADLAAPFESTQMTPLDVQSDVDVLAHVAAADVGPRMADGGGASFPFPLLSLSLSTCVFTSSNLTLQREIHPERVMGGGAVGWDSHRIGEAGPSHK